MPRHPLCTLCHFPQVMIRSCWLSWPAFLFVLPVWLIIWLLRRTRWIAPTTGFVYPLLSTRFSPDTHQPIKKPDFFCRPSFIWLPHTNNPRRLFSPTYPLPCVCFLCQMTSLSTSLALLISGFNSLSPQLSLVKNQFLLVKSRVVGKTD